MLALHFSFCLFPYSNMTQVSQQKVQSYPPTVSCFGLFFFFQYVCFVFNYMLAGKAAEEKQTYSGWKRLDELELCI